MTEACDGMAGGVGGQGVCTAHGIWGEPRPASCTMSATLDNMLCTMSRARSEPQGGGHAQVEFFRKSRDLVLDFTERGCTVVFDDSLVRRESRLTLIVDVA